MQDDRMHYTGERYVPGCEDYATAYEHLHRYLFAKEFVRGKKVLDLASGEGYGSRMLADVAASVTGIEIDRAAVAHASRKYPLKNLSFIEGSLTRVPVADGTQFDVIVCFEALEHIAEHDLFIAETRRLLAPDGLLIVSTPNKAEFTDARDHHNPYHVKELYLDEFRALLSGSFKKVVLCGQGVYACSAIFSLERLAGSQECVVALQDKEFRLMPPGSKVPVYYLALATDADLPAGVLTGNAYMLDSSHALVKKLQRRVAALESQLQSPAGAAKALVRWLRKIVRNTR